MTYPLIGTWSRLARLLTDTLESSEADPKQLADYRINTRDKSPLYIDDPRVAINMGTLFMERPYHDRIHPLFPRLGEGIYLVDNGDGKLSRGDLFLIGNGICHDDKETTHDYGHQFGVIKLFSLSEKMNELECFSNFNTLDGKKVKLSTAIIGVLICLKNFEGETYNSENVNRIEKKCSSEIQTQNKSII